MNKGKINYNALIRSVLRVPFRQKEREHIAENVYAFKKGDIESDFCVTLNSMVFSKEDAETLAFYRTYNKALSGGMRPNFMLLSMVLPESVKEPEMKELENIFFELAKKENVELIGGHTTVSRQVTAPVYTISMFGEGKKICKKKLKEKDAIIITKFAGDTGAWILSSETKVQKELSQSYLAVCKEVKEYLSCEKEAEVFRKYDAWMHDLSEGGLYGALWEMTERFDCGFEIDQYLIPLHQETVEICNALDENPYLLFSTGCILAVVAKEKKEQVLRELEEQGIPAQCIGTIAEHKEKRIHRDDEIRFLERPEEDPLTHFDCYS